MRIDNSMNARTCKVCETVYPFAAGAQECAERGLPKRFPSFKRGDALALAADVFARLFPKWATEQNRFVLAGDLADRNCKRTFNCKVEFDPKKKAHGYKIRVRCIGNEGEIKTNRVVWVWADEVELAIE